MPYLYSEGQKRFLQKKAIEEKDLEDCCNCIGDCDDTKCDGFTRNCMCDKTWTGIAGIKRAQQTLKGQK